MSTQSGGVKHGGYPGGPLGSPIVPRLVRLGKTLLRRSWMIGGGMLRVAAAPIQALESLRSPALRRIFPRYWNQKLRLLLADLVVVAVAAAIDLAFLIPIAGAVVAMAVWLGWRGRANRGERRRWPPGKLLVGSRAIHQPDHFFDAWRRYGPVFKTNHFLEPMACVVGIAEAADLLRDNEQSLGPVPLRFNQFVPGGLARWMEGPSHDEYRKLLAAAFGAQVTRANAGKIDREIDLAFDRMATDAGESGVLPLGYIRDLLFATWAQVFFSIAPTDEDFPELQDLFRELSVGSPRPNRQVEAALEGIGLLIGARVEAETITDSPRPPDPVSALTAVLQRQPDALSNQTTMRNLIYTLETSRSDVGGLVMWLLKHACDNSEYLARLRDEPLMDHETADPQSLANRMVSETIRLEQSEHLFRRAKDDIALQGHRVPAGWLIRICVHESHRDPRIFTDPDTYNPDRFLRSRTTKDGYGPFGIDGRACLGEVLTRRFTGAFVSRLAHGYDVRVTDDGPREMGYYQHWAPNSRFRIQLSSRS